MAEKKRKIKPPTKEEVERCIHPPKKKQKPKPKPKPEPPKNDYSKVFATNILAIAKYKDINVGQMELKVGLGVGYLAQYRSGHFKRGIPLDMAIELAEMVGKDLIDLYTNDYHNIRWKARYDREMNDVEQMKRELSSLQW